MVSKGDALRRSCGIVGIAVILGAVTCAGVWDLRAGPAWLSEIAAAEDSMRAFVDQRTWAAAAIAFAVLAAVTSLPIPIAALGSLIIGWLFEPWLGIVIVSFASTCGATLTYLVSKTTVRTWIPERWASYFRALNHLMERDGPYCVLFLRLMPGIPFFIVNFGLGLTSIRWRSFWCYSQIGMLPATAAYVYAGSSLPSLKTMVHEGVSGVLTWRLKLALVILALLPILARLLLRRAGYRNLSNEENQKATSAP